MYTGRSTLEIWLKQDADMAEGNRKGRGRVPLMRLFSCPYDKERDVYST